MIFIYNMNNCELLEMVYNFADTAKVIDKVIESKGITHFGVIKFDSFGEWIDFRVQWLKEKSNE